MIHNRKIKMKNINRPIIACLVAGISLLSNTGFAQVKNKNVKEIQFKKHILIDEFVTEGSAVGDINKDGKMDIIAGPYWFEAPDWKRHELDTPKKFNWRDSYSNSFLNYAMDVNQDGWLDVIRVDFPGEPAVWYENPKNKAGHWKMHTLYSSVGNESPAFVDIDGDGRIDLLCADSKGNKVIWLKAPAIKGDTAWTVNVISDVKDRGTHQFTHGLGYGDINKDGRSDVFIKSGWWEAPEDRMQSNWTWHPANFGDDCSQMYAMDLDGDGDIDVVSASSHNYGIWWHEQVKDDQGNMDWKRHEISKAFSQTHGLAMVDVNKDGHPDLVTGKRFYAHNGHDPGEEEPAVIYWFEYKPGKIPSWIAHQIDDNSGIGLQVVTQDMNKDKRIDIVIGNKKGVFYFEQLKK